MTMRPDRVRPDRVRPGERSGVRTGTASSADEHVCGGGRREVRMGPDEDGEEGTMGESAEIEVPPHGEHRIPMPDGRTLAAAEWGDPAGLPLVSLHGTPGGRISWWSDPTIDARHGLRRLTLDRPGYGESTRRPGRRVVDVVADVIALADRLGIDSFVVTGGSGGGPHALACAALLPERVLRCLAVVSVAPLGPGGLGHDSWFAGMAEGNVREFAAALEGEEAIRPLVQAERASMLELLEQGRTDFLGDSYEMSEADRAQLRRHFPRLRAQMLHSLAHGVDGWIDDDLAMVTGWGFDVAEIRVPVRISYGRADTLVPPAHGEWLAAHVPRVVAEVTEVGHLGDDDEVERQWAWLAGGDAA